MTSHPRLSQPQAEESADAQLSNARETRDRFVALAFAAADLLFELDGDGRVIFARGATRLLLGYDETELLKQRFLDLVAAADRPVVEKVLKRARSGARFDNVIARFGSGGDHPPLVMRGYYLPDLGGHTFLALRVQRAGSGSHAPSHFEMEKSGLIARKSFVDASADAMRSAATAGEDVQLTLLSIGELDEVERRLNTDTRVELRKTLAASIRATSVDGNTAAQLGPDRYGLIHKADANLAALREEISSAAKQADPEGRGVTLSDATIALDGANLDPQQAVRVLRYAIDNYSERKERPAIRSLSEALSQISTETVGRMERLSAAIDAGRFAIAYQPICDLLTLRPHHFEALIRFDPATDGLTTFETITFAEQVGLIADLDLAMCRKVLGELKEFNRGGHYYVVAVNLSAQSLASAKFLGQLSALLEAELEVTRSIIFEVTESASVPNLAVLNAAIQGLRAAGHLICLDDLGAGEAAFRYLGQLDVDVAKIDGQFVRGSVGSPKGRALLKAMAGVCRDLGVMTVGEMIEDEAQVNIARECGLHYGQGYLFGKPSANIAAFDAPRPTEFRGRSGPR